MAATAPQGVRQNPAYRSASHFFFPKDEIPFRPFPPGYFPLRSMFMACAPAGGGNFLPFLIKHFHIFPYLHCFLRGKFSVIFLTKTL